MPAASSRALDHVRAILGMAGRDTVLVMAPIAVVFSQELGFRPEPFLIAIAVGAGCDFLTPIGHQCNTLVFGAGGYRFGDYARLGAPLSLLVILVGTPLILWSWPL